MYQSHYKLTGKPFQLNPDPRFFYGSRGHQRAMAYLEYGVAQAEGFIVITGEVGAGKTTLVRKLFDGLDRSKLIAVQLVSTQLDSDDLLRSVASAFGLDASGNKSSLLFEIEAYLIDCHREGKRALLLVDEAQGLKPEAIEELRMLSNFQYGHDSLLQSFLLGQPEFRATLQSYSMLQLRQRVIATYHLGPMDSEETRQYIEHRLTHVGWTGTPSFSEQAFALIFNYSAGLPRRINTVCDRLMLMGYLGELEHFEGDEVKEVIAELELDFGMPEDLESAEAKAMALNGGGKHVDGVARGEILERLEKLEARAERLERYVVSTANLNRQMLSLGNRDK